MRRPNMKKLVLAAAVVGGLVGVGYRAHAGYKATWTVFVEDYNRGASGGVGTARSAGDSNSRIGCYVYKTTTARYGICVARNSAGAIGSCLTQDPATIDDIRSVNGISFVFFQWNATTGDCEMVQVRNISENQPMVP